MLTIALLLAIHLIAAMFWVGGLAFAYTILRPATGPLEPPARLALWRRIFERFLPWVGIAILALLVSGFAMMFLIFGSFAANPLYIHLMMGIGIAMMLLYLHLLFAPWRRFRVALDSGTLPDAAKALNQIRIIVGINLVLGTLTILAGGTGRYW